MQTDFEKLIGTRRQEFTVTLETDDGPVELVFTHPKKSLQAIMLDCPAKTDAIQFMMAAGDGFAGVEPPKDGDDIDIVLRSAGVYCLLNELVTPELTKPQRQELVDKMAPHLSQSLSEQVQSAIAKNIEDAAKN